MPREYRERLQTELFVYLRARCLGRRLHGVRLGNRRFGRVRHFGLHWHRFFFSPALDAELFGDLLWHRGRRGAF